MADGDGSYIAGAWEDGWATLAIDRPGHGRSTRVHSNLPTAQVVSSILADLVFAIGEGKYGEFSEVILVGHSAGTALALYAVEHHPELSARLSGLVLTGVVHAPALADIAVPLDASHPANEELDFAGLDSGWMTTLPGRRRELWWSAASPANLVQCDEESKGIWCKAELDDARDFWVTPVTVEVPRVLVIAGCEDNSFCQADARVGRCRDDGALLRNEAQYFPEGANISARLVPNWGHVISPSGDATSYILDWLG
jgi:pimeloyl-ACP methyl ester carboxylesterase